MEQRLSDARPTLTALELDATKVRIMQSAPQQQSGLLARKKGNLMKSRVALVAVLALGVFMSGTGATLAVSGFANSGSAGSAQYPGNNQHGKQGHHVVEGVNSGAGKCSSGSSGKGATSGSGSGSEKCGEVEVQGVQAHGAQGVEAQAVEQVAVTSSSSSLPFTGFVAIPVLLIGLGLLGAGVAMRFRRRDDTI